MHFEGGDKGFFCSDLLNFSSNIFSLSWCSLGRLSLPLGIFRERNALRKRRWRFSLFICRNICFIIRSLSWWSLSRLSLPLTHPFFPIFPLPRFFFARVFTWPNDPLWVLSFNAVKSSFRFFFFYRKLTLFGNIESSLLSQWLSHVSRHTSPQASLVIFFWFTFNLLTVLDIQNRLWHLRWRHLVRLKLRYVWNART